MTDSMTDSMTELLLQRRGPTVFATLNRPQALNALNFPIIRGLNQMLDEAEQDDGIASIVIQGAGDRAFCAGGDIKAAREGGLAWKRGEAKLEDTLQFFVEEYALNRRMYHFKKPLIAFMNGITMGGGVGIAGPCRIRVATEKTLWAMPEVTIGFFPDVGAGYYLTRAPGKTGRYLGLTGQHIGNAADILRCGFATHYIPADKFDPENIVAHEIPVSPELDQTKIDRHFAFQSVEEILASLDAGDGWSKATASLMRTKSPTSLRMTLKHLQASEHEDFDAVSHRDLKLAEACLRGDDLYEGIRAAVVDKDRNPKWADVQDAEAYFL